MSILYARTTLTILRHLDAALIRAAALPNAGWTIKSDGQNHIEWQITRARDALLSSVVADVGAEAIAAPMPAIPAEQSDPPAIVRADIAPFTISY